MEDLKEQLGARADSEYALQEENRRLQVKKKIDKKNFRKKLKSKLQAVVMRENCEKKRLSMENEQLSWKMSRQSRLVLMLMKMCRNILYFIFLGRVRETCLTTLGCQSATARALLTPFPSLAAPGFLMLMLMLMILHLMLMLMMLLLILMLLLTPGFPVGADPSQLPLESQTCSTQVPRFPPTHPG